MSEIKRGQRLSITRLQLKSDSVQKWKDSTLSLRLGEIAISYDYDDALSVKSNFKMKIGQGDKTWSQISDYVGVLDTAQIEQIHYALSDVFIDHDAAYSMISAEIARQLSGDWIKREEFTTDYIQPGENAWLLDCGNAIAP